MIVVKDLEQPTIALDCETFGDDDEGPSVLVVSELGVVYIWHSESIEKLNSAKPRKIAALKQEPIQANKEEETRSLMRRSSYKM